MKEIFIIPFLLAFLFFGVALFAANNNKQGKVYKEAKQEVVKVENFELEPSVLVM